MNRHPKGFDVSAFQRSCSGLAVSKWREAEHLGTCVQVDMSEVTRLANDLG